MSLTIHQYNTRKADIQRHADAALDGLRETAVAQKLTTDEIIQRAYTIGLRSAQDLASLDRQLESKPA